MAPRRLLPRSESVVDVDAIQAMNEMIEADILIMSKSSFCYCAGLISDGIKIFAPEVNPAIEGWLLSAADGSFDRAEFERKVSALVQATASGKS